MVGEEVPAEEEVAGDPAEESKATEESRLEPALEPEKDAETQDEPEPEPEAEKQPEEAEGMLVPISFDPKLMLSQHWRT